MQQAEIPDYSKAVSMSVGAFEGERAEKASCGEQRGNTSYLNYHEMKQSSELSQLS